MKNLTKAGGITEKWSKMKPVSTYACNFELVWNKIKDLDIKSEDYEGVTWPAHAPCRRNFTSSQKLENKLENNLRIMKLLLMTLK